MKKLNVLCIDDNVSVLSLMEKMLPGLLDAEVHAALGPQQALDLMSGGFIPDVLVIDYMMPGRSGLELAIALKQNPAFSKTCMILHSAVGPGLRRSALNAGVYQVIDKPSKMKDLAAGIQVAHRSFAAGQPSPLIAATAQKVDPLARRSMPA